MAPNYNFNNNNNNPQEEGYSQNKTPKIENSSREGKIPKDVLDNLVDDLLEEWEECDDSIKDKNPFLNKRKKINN